MMTFETDSAPRKGKAGPSIPSLRFLAQDDGQSFYLEFLRALDGSDALDAADA
jgi:hypothetical protein